MTGYYKLQIGKKYAEWIHFINWLLACSLKV